MPAKIELELQDKNSKEVLGDLRKNMESASDSAAKLDANIGDAVDSQDDMAQASAKAAQQAKAEADFMKIVAQEVDHAADEHAQLAVEMREAARAASLAEARTRDYARAMGALRKESSGGGPDLGAAMGKGGGIAASVTAVSTGIMATVAAIQAMTDAARTAYEFIDKLSGSSAAFKGLKDSADGFVSSFSDAAKSMAQTDLGRKAISLAKSGLDTFAYGIRELPDLWTNISIATNKHLATLEEYFTSEHSNRRKTIEYLEEEKKRRQELIDMDQQRANEQQSVDNREKISIEWRQKAASAALALEVEGYTTKTQALDAWVKHRNELDRLTREGKLIGDEEVRAREKTNKLQEKLIELEAKESRIQKEREEGYKKYVEQYKKDRQEEKKARIEEAAKAEEEIRKMQLATIEMEKKAKWEALHQEWIGRKQLAMMQQEQHNARVDQLKQYMQAQAQANGQTQGQGQAGPGGMTNAANLRDRIKQNQELVNRQVIRNREEQAALKAGLVVMGPGGRPKRNAAGNLIPQYNKRGAFQRETLKARQQARRDIRQGKVSGAESERAVSGLANQAAENLISKTGKANSSTVEAVKQLVSTANQQAETSAQVADQAKEAQQTSQQTQQMLQQLMQSLNGGGSSQRAQRGGFGR